MATFLVLKEKSCFELKEKFSRFISLAYPIKSENEAQTLLKDIQKNFFDATHICFAYKLNELIKYSDAGEPKGTAGIRILNAIQHFELDYILISIVRYFGGIKLGIGPLGKAYYDAAFGALKNAKFALMKSYCKVKLNFNSSLFSFVVKNLNSLKAKIIEQGYDDYSYITFYIEEEKFELFNKVLIELNSKDYSSCIIENGIMIEN